MLQLDGLGYHPLLMMSQVGHNAKHSSAYPAAEFAFGGQISEIPSQ
jgi:hypothetical protein